jgi:hypothetical protein
MLEKSPVNGRREGSGTLVSASNLSFPVEDERTCRSRATPEPKSNRPEGGDAMKIADVEQPYPATTIKKGG